MYMLIEKFVETINMIHTILELLRANRALDNCKEGFVFMESVRELCAKQ